MQCINESICASTVEILFSQAFANNYAIIYRVKHEVVSKTSPEAGNIPASSAGSQNILYASYTIPRVPTLFLFCFDVFFHLGNP